MDNLTANILQEIEWQTRGAPVIELEDVPGFWIIRASYRGTSTALRHLVKHRFTKQEALMELAGLKRRGGLA